MGLFREKVKNLRLSKSWRIESAGTWAAEGLPALESVQKVMADRGLDLNSHRSRIVTEEVLNSFQLILVMERGQKEALQIEFPLVSKRVFLLSEMAGTVKDIPDPIDLSMNGIKEVVKVIEGYIDAGFDRIVRLALKGN
jgi:protein-tyrosine phosphatase